MNNLQIFDNPQFGAIRTLVENENILFCGNDVARALGYTNPRKALGDHCKGVTKRYTLTQGGEQEMSFIPESDCYRLVVHSKLPAAEKFERWVFEEVLPSIRKHGMYATPETLMELLQNPQSIKQVLQALCDEQSKRMELEAKIAEDAPKVQFAEAVSEAEGCILIGSLAKMIGVKPRTLFAELRRDGFLMRSGRNNNVPTQRAINAKLLDLKENPVETSCGVFISITPLVTGKGQRYFAEKYCKTAE